MINEWIDWLIILWQTVYWIIWLVTVCFLYWSQFGQVECLVGWRECSFANTIDWGLWCHWLEYWSVDFCVCWQRSYWIVGLVVHLVSHLDLVVVGNTSRHFLGNVSVNHTVVVVVFCSGWPPLAVPTPVVFPCSSPSSVLGSLPLLFNLFLGVILLSNTISI